MGGRGTASEANNLDKSAGSGIINTGARYGAINSQSERASIHAETYYRFIRSINTDIAKISENTGIKKSNIERVKAHLFLKEYDLGGAKPQHFYPDYEISQSWQWDEGSTIPRFITAYPDK